MRYYTAADVHGFYTPLTAALRSAGYFDDPEPHKLVLLGDVLDRGSQPKEMQRFVLDMMDKDELVLVRGNHEDLFERLATTENGVISSRHLRNGTYVSALTLTDTDRLDAVRRPWSLAARMRKTPFFTDIIPASVNYFETDGHIFVHGWIPCVQEGDSFAPMPEWRSAGDEEWKKSRWYVGMDAVNFVREEKTILCGHRTSSYGHNKYEHKGPMHGEGADYSPYTAPGIISIDGCTVRSGTVNVVVIEE